MQGAGANTVNGTLTSRSLGSEFHLLILLKLQCIIRIQTTLGVAINTILAPSFVKSVLGTLAIVNVH